MSTLSFILISFVVMSSIYTLVYTKVYPVMLPPEAYEEINEMAKVARKKTKKAMRQKAAAENEERNEGVRILFGKGDQGEVLLQMRYAPYIFIGGTPGAGKTNLLNNMIVSMAEWTRNISFYILSTQKGIKFNLYKNLLAQVVNVGLEENLWDQYLDDLLREMEARERIIAKAAEKTIEIEDVFSYNKVFSKDPLPYVVFIIDEVYELLTEERKKRTLEKLLPLVKRGRSSGIYGVLATQYLSAEEMTGRLLGNMVAKVALRTASAEDSRKIIGERGAENLDPSKGEGMIKSPSHNALKFVNTEIKPRDVEKRIKKINKKYGYLTSL